MKSTIIAAIEELRTLLDQLQVKVNGLADFIDSKLVAQYVRDCSHLWSEKVEPGLRASQLLPIALIEQYRDRLIRLYRLGTTKSRKTSLQAALQDVLRTLGDDLLIPVRFAPADLGAVEEIERTLLESLEYPDQKGYLAEAIGCLKAGCIRAATVLGWSAAMHHLHSKIEELGFAQFARTADELVKKPSGRFRRFTGIGPIESISDLREAPDRKVLTVLDAMGILESNQRQRLEACLDMRIQCSHPGDAPMTEANIRSFFSDLAEIVFKNPRLKV